MAEPEPIDPTSETPPAEPPRSRPDWLVGAEEGAQSEYSRKSELEAQPVDLRRPSAPDEPTRIGLPLANRPTPEPVEPEPEEPVAWRAAASSVPQLRLVSPTAAKLSTKPELSRRVADEELEPEESVDAYDAAPPPNDDLAPRAPTAKGPAPVRKPSVLDEPWWLIALERLATDRKLQLILGSAVAVVVALVIFWPRGGSGVSLSSLRHHPERYQGQSVQVEGRVGDVFSVGGAYAFNLHQGRDTLVVYTRSRTPVTRQKVKVTGSLSMGYLDGIPRLALFETGS